MTPKSSPPVPADAEAGDITQRLILQASILAQVSDAVIALDNQQRVTYLNLAAEQRYGVPAAEAVGRPLADLHTWRWEHPEDEAAAYQSLHEQGHWRGENFHVTRLGREIPVESTVSVLRDDSGNPVGLLATIRDITERKQIEQKLRHSEGFVRSVLDNLFAFVGVMTPDGTLIEANRAPVEAAGVTLSDVLGKKFWDTIWWNYAPEVQTQLRDACQRALSGEVVRYDVPVRMAGDSRMWIDFQIAPLRDPEGHVTHLIPSAMDITDRKHAEQTLRQSEERLKFIAERAGVGHWYWDLGPDHLEWSPLCKRLFGIPDAEPVTYSQFLEALHPDDRERTDRSVRACLEGGGTRNYDIEYRAVWRDGAVHWIHAKGDAIFEGRQPVRMAGIAMDITDRKLAEQNLRQNEERLRVTLEATNTALWDWRPLTGEVYWSPEHCTMLGYEVGSVEPSYANWAARVHPEDLPAAEAAIRESMREHREYHHEFRVVLPDGLVRWVEARANYGYNAAGDCDRMLGVMNDITDRKQAQAQLEALNQTLEQRVAQRTAESQWRADQLQKLAAQMTQVEEHERRRLAQLLHDGLQQSLVAAKIKVATAGRLARDTKLQKALKDVAQILDESINESRSLTKELSPPVLYDGGLAAGLIWLGRETQRKYDLPVDVQVTPDLEPDDLTTKVLVFQAARELILNAVKHADASSLRISLAPAGEGHLALTIQDDGKGFDPDVITGREWAGGGFGLFSIRERLDVIGGELAIASSASTGTQVRIVAPCLRAQPVQHATSAPANGSASPVLESESPCVVRVLLADDHPAMRKGLAELLAEHPGLCVVAQASDGIEALELSLQLRPDVVLMDITMPRMDGIEATRLIRQSAPEVAVVILSMHESEDMVARTREAGACAYLSKTAPLEDLINVILSLSPRTLQPTKQA